MTAIGLNIRIPKDSLIKLNYHENQQIVVKFNGGRQIHGKLKSWDKTMNLILDNTSQIMGVDKNQKQQIKRQLGLVIVKGSQIQCIALKNGYVLIDNPYAAAAIEQGQNQGQQGQQNQKQEEQQKKQSQK